MRSLVPFLLLASACAIGKPAEMRAPSAGCSGMVAAVAAPGTEIVAAPDGNSDRIATLQGETRLCAGNETEGFGFRRVKLPDGRVGFVSEERLQ